MRPLLRALPSSLSGCRMAMRVTSRGYSILAGIVAGMALFVLPAAAQPVAPPAVVQPLEIPPEAPVVDKRIILLIDSSKSMTDEHFSWQLNGYADAFLSPESIAAIKAGKNSAIAVALAQFSSRVGTTLDWTIVTPDNIEEFADTFRRLPRYEPGSTAIGMGLNRAQQMIQRTKIRSTQTIIIVSGDGPNNAGFAPWPISEEISSWLKTTIVGVALVAHEEYELETYYRKFVARGPGNFVVWARSEDDLKNALVRVLTLNDNSSQP